MMNNSASMEMATTVLREIIQTKSYTADKFPIKRIALVDYEIGSHVYLKKGYQDLGKNFLEGTYLLTKQGTDDSTDCWVRIANEKGELLIDNGSIKIEDELDPQSENLVKNKTITIAINGLQEQINANDSDIQRINELLNLHGEEITQLKENDLNKSNLLSDHDKRIKSNASEIGTLNQVATSQEQRIDDLESANLGINTRLTDIDSLNSTQGEEIREHSTDINEIKQTNTQQGSDISKNANDITAIGERVTANENAISEHTTTIGEHTSSIEQINGTLNTQSQSIGSVEERINQAEAVATEQGKRIESNTQGLATASASVQDHETRLVKAESDVSDISGKVNTNTTAIATQTTKVSGLETKVNTLDKAVETATSPITIKGTLNAVSELPKEGNKGGDMYFVKTASNTYDQHVWVATSASSGEWKIVGNTNVAMEVVDNTTTDSATKALSARQGKLINDNSNKKVFTNSEIGNSFFIELYLKGIDVLKKYIIKIVRRNFNNQYAFDIYDSDKVVASFSDNYSGIVEDKVYIKLDESNNSGINGYAVINWDVIEMGKSVDVNWVINNSYVSDIKYSPFLYSYNSIRKVLGISMKENSIYNANYTELDGYINKGNVVQSEHRYHTSPIKLKRGQSLLLVSQLNSSFSPFWITDEQGSFYKDTKVPSKNLSSVIHTIYTPTQDCFVSANYYRDIYPIDIYIVESGVYTNINDSINSIDEKIDAVSLINQTKNELQDKAIANQQYALFKNKLNRKDEDFSLGYISLQDGVTIYSSKNVCTSGFIEISKEFPELIASINGRAACSSVSYSGICYYDNNKKFINGIKGAECKSIAKWSDGVKYFRVIFRGDTDITENDELQVELGNKITYYEKFGKPYYPKYNNRNQVESLLLKGCATIKSSDIQTGILEITDFPKYIKKDTRLQFYANVSNLSSPILIGKGYGHVQSLYIKIDSTNISFYVEQDNTLINAIPHNLNINTFISVNWKEEDGKVYIVVLTKDGMFDTIYTGDIPHGDASNAVGTPFVKCETNILSNIIFSATNSSIQSPIWMFGDSYFGTSVIREWHYLYEWGYKNIMIDAIGGLNCIGAYNDLLLLLKLGCPKYLVWCIGVNGNNDTTINYYSKIIELCEENNITLIMAKVPNTSVVGGDNKILNNYVENSGFRYIDRYKAVGCQPYNNETNTCEWYEGYMNDDNVHPSEKGAKALAMQTLIDFPEIMQVK